MYLELLSRYLPRQFIYTCIYFICEVDEKFKIQATLFPIVEILPLLNTYMELYSVDSYIPYLVMRYPHSF